MICPCGTGEPFAACCRPLHLGRGSRATTARTAERLMRSRYSAFATRDAAYLLATWHPRTRPPSLDFDPDVEWRRLRILDTTDGLVTDDTGTVTFAAHYWHDGLGQYGQQRETSAFVRIDGHWFYVGSG